MQQTIPAPEALEVQTFMFHRDVLDKLSEAQVPFLVGGGYAFACHTSIQRPVKDLDLFLRRSDCARALSVLEQAGYGTELVFEHWLAKVYQGDEYIDFIFNSGNGLAEVTDSWFANAGQAEVLGRTVQICGPEEMIWSKAFVMERERYDGADVAHLLRACGPELDWSRLVDYFGPHWRVLLSHLVLFSYVYPNDPNPVPQQLMHDLLLRWQRARPAASPSSPVCQGTLLSRGQYLVDIEEWEYKDARLKPHGSMSAPEIAKWTQAIEADRKSGSHA